MKEHIRLRALKKVCELLERETGMRVYRGRQVVGADIPMPFLVINETIRSGDTVQTNDRANRNDRVDFLLSGYIDCESVTHPIDICYEYIAKIEQAFYKIYALNSRGNPQDPEFFMLGNLVSDFKYDAPVAHNPPNEVQSKSYFYLYFSFWVAYNCANPSGDDV